VANRDLFKCKIRIYYFTEMLYKRVFNTLIWL